MRLWKILKLSVLCSGGSLFIAYQFYSTSKTISRIVNSSVLNTEKKHAPEFIYIDDPTYNKKVTQLFQQDKENKNMYGLSRFWKSLRHSITWHLLWLCQHGNDDQRNIALQQLASFKYNKSWDYVRLAQAMDQNTSILLARTEGASLHYFLPPPLHVRRAALSPQLLSYKFRDMIAAVQEQSPHSCIQHFLEKYFVNVHEQSVEVDQVPAKPDSISERDLCMLCLDAIHHHLQFHIQIYSANTSANKLIQMELLPRLGELLCRNRGDIDIDLAFLRIATIMSVHTNLLTDFFQNGLIGELARLLRSGDIRLASSAAVCLANLSGECSYLPGIYLLHPLYRTIIPHECDTVLIHGLRGGVFVTWRQRDCKNSVPVGLMEATISDVDNEVHNALIRNKFIDPDMKEMIEDLHEFDNDSLLSGYEIVLHDIPIDAKRESSRTLFTAPKLLKHACLCSEEQDFCDYTTCWPKDWLPQDCDNLRILGVNYWSTISEWLEKCPMQNADIATKAADLANTLSAAKVANNEIPVVWLAHSMGGLIVKQLLNDADKSQDANFKQLCSNTKAVLFFSTPHKGSSFATLNRASAAILWPSSDVQQLKQNEPFLLDLHASFLEISDKYNWETVSFAEGLPTLITAFKVPINFVEAKSADVGRGLYYQFPLDHLAICKPATRQSVIYLTVLETIQKSVTRSDSNSKTSLIYTILQNIINIIIYVLGESNTEVMASLLMKIGKVEQFLCKIYPDYKK